VPQYLDMLERRGSALNIASFVGHSALRSYVMGEAATQRVATDAEIAEMRRLVLEAMRAGAIGFSTSTSPAHNGEGGVPMPSRLADEKELRALVVSLKDAGRGVFMLTKGGHTRMAFLEELAAQSTRPVVVAALLHSSANPDAVFQDLDAARDATARGHKVVGAMSCCPLSMDFTLHSPYTFEGLESWKPALGRKGASFRKVLRDPKFRQAIRAELAKPAHFRLFNGQWSQVRVVESARKECSTSCSTWRSRKVSTQCSRRCCSTPTRRRSGACFGTPPAWCRCRTRARTLPSSMTPASGCTCSGTGCASWACCRWKMPPAG
jgi:N-acyl-D-aspartate/D-glutamate deacylase